MRETYARWTKARAQFSRGGARLSHGYNQLALKYRCSMATARDIVKGNTRVEAGGPISGDHD